MKCVFCDGQFGSADLITVKADCFADGQIKNVCGHCLPNLYSATKMFAEALNESKLGWPELKGGNSGS